MAEKETKKEDDGKKDDKKEKKSGGGMLGWIIMGLVVVVFAAGGYGLSMVLAKSNAPADTGETAVEEDPAEKINKLLNANATDAKPWNYELDAVVANLDEPGVTRFIRTTVILEMAAEMDVTLGTTFLEEKVPYMIDWMTTYLAGLTIEEVRGSQNQSKIKTQIRENFNEILFPDSDPLINHVLLKDFAIQ